MDTQAQREEEEALLLSLERQLMDPSFRRDREAVATLLTQDFREFGSSGRIWTHAEILNLLATETAYIQPAIENFQMQSLAQDIKLVTYITIRTKDDVSKPTRTLRSSIWVRQGSQWLMLFHQGTP